jgi:hypothetical protein
MSSGREKSSTSKAARNESKSSKSSEKKIKKDGDTERREKDREKNGNEKDEKTSRRSTKEKRSSDKSTTRSQENLAAGGDDKSRTRPSADKASAPAADGGVSPRKSLPGLIRRKSSVKDREKKETTDKKEKKVSDKKEAKNRDKTEKKEKKSKKSGEGTLRKSVTTPSSVQQPAPGSSSASPPLAVAGAAGASLLLTKKGSGVMKKATPKSLGKATSSKVGGDFLQRLEGIERTKTAVDFTKSHATSQVKKGAKAVEETTEWDDETQEKVSFSPFHVYTISNSFSRSPRLYALPPSTLAKTSLLPSPTLVKSCTAILTSPHACLCCVVSSVSSCCTYACRQPVAWRCGGSRKCCLFAFPRRSLANSMLGTATSASTRPTRSPPHMHTHHTLTHMHARTHTHTHTHTHTLTHDTTPPMRFLH